ncbi:nitrogen assimilation transcription factor nit-4, partial [Cercophora scortea]
MDRITPTPTASGSYKGRSPSEAASDTSSQDQSSPSATHTSRPPTKQQIRHRASVACASCRERRIRCVVPEGASECTQCKRTGAECVIKNDDERRRPISKAYMSSLSNRIELLEGLLQERGVVPPPAIHPPKTRQEAQASQQHEQEQTPARDTPQPSESNLRRSPETQKGNLPGMGQEELNLHNFRQAGRAMSNMYSSQQHPMDSLLLSGLSPELDDIGRRGVSEKGISSLDQTSAAPRFYGPTANVHVYGQVSCQPYSRGPPEQARRAERVIRALSPVTRDYLMTCFWSHYNPAHQVVDQDTFEADQNTQNPRFYSSFLHITMLAGGYRFADREREDVKRMTLGNWESTLHRESKYMLDIELERPGGVPSVQALLILADLEGGVGRDSTGWMYSGMATRLAFDLGLHAKCTDETVPDVERRVRRKVMMACVMYDRYLALLLGRPTSIKNQDLGIDLLPQSLSTASTAVHTPSSSELGSNNGGRNDVAVYQKIIELMDLAARIADSQNSCPNTANMFATNDAEENAYLNVITLDRQLQTWYRRIPEHLAWKPANIKSAPLGFFILHQQYHVCMILLHRPWAKYGPDAQDGSNNSRYPSPASPRQAQDGPDQFHISTNSFARNLNNPQSIDDDNRVALSRSMCTQHAVRVARIFWQHRQRLDGQKMSLPGIQHAGTAAIALMSALAHKSNELDQQSNLRYLQVISGAIYDMSRIYQPAAKMYQLLKSMLINIRAGMANPSTFDAGALVNQLNQGN